MEDKQQQPPKIELFGITFSDLSRSEALEVIRDLLNTETKALVVTPNVDHVVRHTKDKEFREAYGKATLVFADGMPVVFASRLLGKPIREKISGSEMFEKILKLAEDERLKIFLLGGTEETGRKAEVRLKEEFPGLTLAGRSSPPVGFQNDPREDGRVVSEINEARPDLLFVLLGSPKQEIWVSRHWENLNIRMAFCFGAAMDFYAGTAVRAPRWMQNSGLEWFWRLTREPFRLGKRYLVDNAVPFARILLLELLGRNRNKEHS